MGRWDQGLSGRVTGRRCSRSGHHLASRRKDDEERTAGLDELVVLLRHPLDLGIGVQCLTLLGEQRVLMLQLGKLR